MPSTSKRARIPWTLQEVPARRHELYMQSGRGIEREREGKNKKDMSAYVVLVSKLN